MTYDPSELTPVDVIRGLAVDTDTTAEILTDAQYEAILARYGVVAETDTAGFYRAAAEALRRVAITLERRFTSISNPDAGSMGWSDRTRALRAQADALDAKAEEIENAGAGGFWGPVVTVRGSFLTGTEETERW